MKNAALIIYDEKDQQMFGATYETVLRMAERGDTEIPLKNGWKVLLIADLSASEQLKLNL